MKLKDRVALITGGSSGSFYCAFFALSGLVLAPLAVAHASSLPADSTYFCQPHDSAQWERDRSRPAAKRLDQESEGQPEPPFGGTVWIDPDIITPSDPTALEDITAAGRGHRTMYDRRSDWITVNAYLFNARFDDGLTAEIQVNPEFGSASAAMVEANKYGRAIGQLPTVLRTNVETVWIHKGDYPAGGGNNNILIHVGLVSDWRKEFLEEILVHEGAHTSLDPDWMGIVDAVDWRTAQMADGHFISDYARDYPEQEDIAESFLPYLAVRYRSNRISPFYEQTVLETMPNRIAYFDQLLQASASDAMHPITEDLRLPQTSTDVDADEQAFEWPPELVACSQQSHESNENGGDEWVNLEPYYRNQLQRLLPITAGKKTEIIFVNNSTIEVLFYWLANDLSERYYGRVAACDSTIQHTFADHIWIVKDQHGKNLAMFQAEAKTGRAFIGPQMPTDAADNEQQGSASAQLAKVSGDNQQGLASAQLARPFVVSVLDQNGSPLAGVAVSFSVAAGGGTLSALTDTTDANGRARSTLTLGRELGTNTVEATVEGLQPVLFTATAIVQTPHSLAKVSGDGQEGTAGAQLAAPFVVSVLDQDGSSLAGVDVTFAVTAGGGMLSATPDANPCTVVSSTSSITATTDANGQAATRLTLGREPGTNAVEATVEGLEPVIFTATAAGQAMPHSLTKVCGDAQEGTAITQLAEPLVVSVVDEEDAAMAGVVVSFAVTAGGGTLSDTTTTTDANGRAATRLTLGIEAGINAVEATVEGLEPVTFTAMAQESPFASLFDLFQSGKRVALPDRPQLAQNAPNPFNSQTVLFYFLPAPGLARVEVFTLTGQRVAVLRQGPQQAGYHRLHWDGRDAAGAPLASGIYLCRLVTDEAVLTRKLTLLQ